MAPPSKLAIVTSSVARLMKDKQSYQKELEEQEERIKKLENETSEDENAGYLLKQERGNLEETKRMIPDLQKRIVEASKKLEQQLSDDAASATPEEIAAAENALKAVGSIS